MIGDLAESLLKRDMQRKDSSSWLPGLGGVLDIIDAVLVAAPVGWLCWVLGLVGPECKNADRRTEEPKNQRCADFGSSVLGSTNFHAITSVHNPRVKAAARLRDRKGRDEQGRIIIDGVREIGLALAAASQVVELYFFPSLCEDERHQQVLGRRHGSRRGADRGHAACHGKAGLRQPRGGRGRRGPAAAANARRS